MSENVAAAAVHHGAEPVGKSLPFVILSAIFVGVGLFGMFYWLLTFVWLWFGVGLAGLLLGAILLFLPQTGADRTR